MFGLRISFHGFVAGLQLIVLFLPPRTGYLLHCRTVDLCDSHALVALGLALYLHDWSRHLARCLHCYFCAPAVFPRPIDMYSESSRAWVLPLNFIFSFAWALEL